LFPLLGLVREVCRKRAAGPARAVEEILRQRLEKFAVVIVLFADDVDPPGPSPHPVKIPITPFFVFKFAASIRPPDAERLARSSTDLGRLPPPRPSAFDFGKNFSFGPKRKLFSVIQVTGRRRGNIEEGGKCQHSKARCG